MILTYRNVIVTGASQGLGAVIAEALVREGASVLLCARSAKTLAATAERLRALAGPTQIVAAFPCDMADESAIDALVAEALRQFPHIDALVNNAGIQGPLGPIETTDWDEWKATIATNLFGPIYLCRALIPHFKSRGYGKIVNLSGGGATNPTPGISAYAASKVALVRLTETMAEELRAYRVDVNAVAPGMLKTRMTQKLLDAGPEAVGADFHARIVKNADDGGMSLERPANLCAYLCSAASDGVTGKLIAAPWDPWPFVDEHRGDLDRSDIYTLRRILPKDRGKGWGD